MHQARFDQYARHPIWQFYIMFLVIIPAGIMVIMLLPVPNKPEPNLSSQAAIILWLSGHVFLRGFFPYMSYYFHYEPYISGLRFIYITTSIFWFVFGLVLISIKEAFYINHKLWVLSLCTFVIDFVITGIILPACYYFKRSLLLIEEPIGEQVPQEDVIVFPYNQQEGVPAIIVPAYQQEGIPNNQ